MNSDVRTNGIDGWKENGLQVQIPDEEVNKHTICRSEEAKNNRPRLQSFSSHAGWP